MQEVMKQKSHSPGSTPTAKPHRKVCKRGKEDDSIENLFFILYIVIFLLSLKTRPTWSVIMQNELDWDPMNELEMMAKFWYLVYGMWAFTTLLTWHRGSFSLSTCMIVQYVECISCLTGNLPALKDISFTHGKEAASLAHLAVAMFHGQFLLLLVTAYAQWAKYRGDASRKRAFLVIVAVWVASILLARGYLPALFPDKPDAYGDIIVWGCRALVCLVVIMMIDACKLLVTESRPSLDRPIAIASFLAILGVFLTFGHDVYSPYLEIPRLL